MASLAGILVDLLQSIALAYIDGHDGFRFNHLFREAVANLLGMYSDSNESGANKCLTRIRGLKYSSGVKLVASDIAEVCFFQGERNFRFSSRAYK